MLQTLCGNKYFNDFVTISKETKYLFDKREKYRFPDWFSVAITDFLESYTDSDITVFFTMVFTTVLVMSRNLPPDEKLVEVFHQLRNKRRFQDVSDLVKKCFEHSVILSQLEIRKIIAFLEEWKETDASIFVYTKMRQCIQDQSRTVLDWRTVRRRLRRLEKIHFNLQKAIVKW